MVSISSKDSEGKTICPICKKHYIPDLQEVSKYDHGWNIE
jgi:hypothetical protein